jgi:cellobiose phosphorylase
MRYGHFSEDGREYLITNLATPSPWINYLYNGRYFSTISANGGGLSYYRSPLHGRITRYRINDVPPDRPGKYIYAKDLDSGGIWSLTWQPVGRNVEAYRAAHGFGYTRAEAEVEGIASSVLFFVPPDDDREIWAATITNRSDRRRRLALTGYVEFALGHALVDLINQCDDQHFNRVHFEKDHNALFATKTYWVTETRGTQHQENKEWDCWAYFTVNRSVTGYETVREKFLGPYRNENNPLSIETGVLSSKDTDFGNAVGALQIEIDLAPGESRDVIFSLGVIPKAEFMARKIATLARFRNRTEVEASREILRRSWDSFFAHTRAEIPDAGTNVFLNYWIPYQAKTAFDIGRVASFYYWGIGRGFGFRDTAQDTIAVVIADAPKAKERIGLYHHFYGDGQGEFTRHCDDPVWFILAVDEYLKETGDFGLLDQTEPFLDGPPGSILDHLLAVVEFARRNLGPHGLPIFGRGDWNDTLDYIGGKDGGESVWGGMFTAAMLERLADLLEYREQSTTSEKTSEKNEKTKESTGPDSAPAIIAQVRLIRDAFRKAVDDHCWDGAWYIRAFGENNRRIGSSANAAGKIFINTQSWAVIAGLPDRGRLVQAMDSARDKLGCEFGPKICAPAFREIDPNIGLITRCVRGKKENGAVFGHPVPWLIQAECLLRRGGRAYDYFRTLLPDRVDSDMFVAEPYVYSQYITSDEHGSPGRASHSWQTGTAAWMYRVAYDWILGIRPTFAGLLIDPVIPASWTSFRVERVFRGCRYLIEVQNPEGRESGVSEISVDGRRIEGNVLPLALAGLGRVTVRM